MKCKNCGGEVRLEDMYCPYCGSPNEEGLRHARDMQHYQNEFQQTKEDVIDRAGRQSRTAVRVAVTALLLLAIAAHIFIQTNGYAIRRMWTGLTTRGNEDLYREQIEKYLEDEDYIALSAYCSEIDLYDFEDLYDAYYPIVRVSNTYRYACNQIMKLVNPQDYSNPESTAKYASEYIQDFYEALDPEKYSYYDSFDSPEIQEHVAAMTEQMEALLVAYLSMTPEDAKSMSSISRGNRVILVEKGLEQYVQEAEDE